MHGPFLSCLHFIIPIYEILFLLFIISQLCCFHLNFLLSCAVFVHPNYILSTPLTASIICSLPLIDDSEPWQRWEKKVTIEKRKKRKDKHKEEKHSGLRIHPLMYFLFSAHMRLPCHLHAWCWGQGVTLIMTGGIFSLTLSLAISGEKTALIIELLDSRKPFL